MVLAVSGNPLTVGKDNFPRKFIYQTSHIAEFQGKVQIFQGIATISLSGLPLMVLDLDEKRGMT